MNKFDRLYELRALFHARRYPVSLADLAESLQCSPATVKRLIAKLRHELGAPIRYDPRHNGYILEQKECGPYELPGLWFSVSELQALLTIHELLSHLQPVVLQAEFSLFKDRIRSILEANNVATGELGRRFRILGVGIRTCRSDFFKSVVTATLQRRRLDIRYHGREKDRLSRRVVSPQRLVYYRENWYLDAWCHERKGLRTLALERIRSVRVRDEAALDLDGERLDEYYGASYGIFAGPATRTAILRFTPERARWIAEERWHPDQEGSFLDDGSFELALPFSDSRELLLDILRYGPDVEVVAPEDLRRQVRDRLARALEVYRKRSGTGHHRE